MADLDPSHVDKEVLPFMSLPSRPDVRCVAMSYFLGLTGSEDGRKFICSNDKYLKAIVDRTVDDQSSIAKDAYLALVNLSTEEPTAWTLMNFEAEDKLFTSWLQYVLKPESEHADIVCMLLSNLSRPERCSMKIVDSMIADKDKIGFDRVIQVFCREDFNKKAKLHYLGPFLSNLTQVREARKYVLDQEKCVIQRLLPFTQYMDSVTRRGGIVGTLRNCCFEPDYHEWLLADKVDILPHLLLPLAGPEEFDEDDMEKLPEDLQYLQPDKQREPDPDIRRLLVEAINQFCARKVCRQFVKDKNTYVILRELHNWEKDPAALIALEKLIQVLIGDEPEPGMEDLRTLDIPENVSEKFRKADELTEKDIAEETAKLELEKKDDTENVIVAVDQNEKKK